ncbi:MAG TPA: hypothetical protein VED16_00125 [Candidatus Acidoferrum sp.]|nr:hypothetical protein [Candidatus Acidoferrum sp.]
MNAQRQLLLVLIAVMIVSSVLTAGCMSSNNKNETNQSQPTSSGAEQDQVLKLMLVKIRDVPAATTGSLESWNETWIDANTVKVNEVSGDKSNDTTTVFSNFTLKRFTTIDDATKFVKGETNGFNLFSTTPQDTDPYNRATGHRPLTYAYYIKTSQVQLGQPIINSYIVQTDDIVMYGEDTSHS